MVSRPLRKTHPGAESALRHPSPRLPFGLAVAVVLCLTLWTPPGLAHPHVWIDLEIVLLADDNDHVKGIQQTWVLDPTYSQYLYDDALEHFAGTTPEEQLAGLAAEILDNLGEYQWYTEFYADDQRIYGAPVADTGGITFDGRNLRIHFEFELDTRINPRQHHIRYKIFDPTYFIEVLHLTGQPPRLTLSSGACELSVRQPRPDPAIVMQAMLLDFDQTGDPDLGRHFAEEVSVRC